MVNPPSSRQPPRRPWTMETFIREREMAMTNSLDLSTRRTYSSALNSWIAFTDMHHFSLEPTPDTLSFFIVYMSHHISPRSVKSYLSGLVQQLATDFPSIRETRASSIVTKTMKGCLKSLSKPIQRKVPLTESDLRYVESRFRNALSHNDLLFVALIVTGFHGLLRLGDLTFPDDHNIWDWRKVARRNSVSKQPFEVSFTLPEHKGDRFFAGDTIVIRPFHVSSIDPIPAFARYLTSRDRLFPASSPLWLTSQGTVPTRSFYMTRFHRLFPKDYGGASMRAGGATHLAKLGVSSQVIRAMGRWYSEAWELYIRVHPAILQELLPRRRLH